MSAGDRRGLYGFALGFSVLFALRPHPRVDGLVHLATAPSRVLAELAGPVDLFQRKRVRAAEEHLGRGAEAEMARSHRLRSDLRRHALPEAASSVDRRLIHARVLRRIPGDADRVEIELAGGHGVGLRPGMPVVVGEVYVGRVERLGGEGSGLDRRLAIVELVAGSDARVGARWIPDETGGEDGGGAARALGFRMVVGGLVASGRAATQDPRLAVHNPEVRELGAGVVLVDEGPSALDEFADQARGFRLGRLEVDGRGVPGIVPELDYAAGLAQVVIVAPATIDRPADRGPENLVEDLPWRGARRLGAGDPDGRRAGILLGIGTLGGVRRGAAVVHGMRLVGRVDAARPLASTVRLIEDPGASVLALARVGGREHPVALGRLRSLGPVEPPPDGLGPGERVIRMGWTPVVPLPSPPEGRRAWNAEVFTASGESGVPSGLRLGIAGLPGGPGPHEIWLREIPDGRRVKDLSVLAVDAGSDAGEQSP